MSCQTTHLKLLNAMTKAAEDLNLPKGNEFSAHQFYSDLFLSGFERIILVRHSHGAPLISIYSTSSISLMQPLHRLHAKHRSCTIPLCTSSLRDVSSPQDGLSTNFPGPCQG